MSRVTTEHDRGLRAVARVREVRERDSRIGLQQALHEERTAGDQVARIDAALAAHRDPEGAAGHFVAVREMLVGQHEVIRAARDQLAAAQVVALDAGARWRSDRSRLDAVESLLARRAAERLAERLRREVVELDDIAAQRWLRLHPHPGGAA
ncbi:MAG: flagellar FliJ family protein [Nocardioides sp.]